MIEYIKRFIRDDRSYFGILIILVATSSFGLGRQSLQVAPIVTAPSTMGQQAASVTDTQAASATALAPEESPLSLPPTLDTAPLPLVASKNGTKYHRLDCSGAKQIAEQNKISFDSIAAARAAGYSPAANCKGLE